MTPEERAAAARRYLQMLGHPSFRRRTSPPSREIVLTDPIEITADLSTQGTRNIQAALPEFLAEPFNRIASAPGLTGDIVRAASINAERVLDNENLSAMQEGTAQGLTFGFGDEIEGAINAAANLDPGRYSETRDSARNRIERARENSPVAFYAGMGLGGLPSAILAPAVSAPTILGRIGQAALYGAGFGALSGAGASNEETASGVATDAAQSAGMGAAIGAGAQGIFGEIVPRVAARVLGRARELADDATQPLREVLSPPSSQTTPPNLRSNFDEELAILRQQQQEATRRAAGLRLASTGARGRGDLRRLDALPGGIEEVADEVRSMGISPNRSTNVPQDVAQARAGIIYERSGGAIRDVNARMQQLARQGTNEALIDTAPLAGVYEEIADRLARTGQQSRAAAFARQAQHWRENPMVDMETAKFVLDGIDGEIYTSAAPNPMVRENWIDSAISNARRALRQSMDDAIGRVYPDELPQYQRARREFQVSNAITGIGDDASLRDAAGRQVSLTDTIAASAGLTGDTLNERVRNAATNFVFNRILRQNEHAVMAAFTERRAESLLRQIESHIRDGGSRAAYTKILRDAYSRGSTAYGRALLNLIEYDPRVAEVIFSFSEADGQSSDTEINESELDALSADPLSTIIQNAGSPTMPEEGHELSEEELNRLAEDPLSIIGD